MIETGGKHGSGNEWEQNSGLMHTFNLKLPVANDTIDSTETDECFQALEISLRSANG